MFEKPYYLLAIWLVPLLALLLVYDWRRKRRAGQRLFAEAMRRRLMPELSPARAVVRGVLLTGAVLFLVFALARPRWGEYYEDLEIRGGDIFILLDVSRSMLAEDLRPNRLERAKSDIRDLLDRVQGDRVGLIVFAGEPILLVPLTSDDTFLRETLAKVDTNSAPRGGTAIGDAIRLAIRSMEADPQRVRSLLMITDGEDVDASFPVETAREAAAAGIKTVFVGIGDPITGARIPVVAPDGSRTYLQYEGADVWSKVDEALLAEMARKSDGIYLPIGMKTYDLGEFYVARVLGRTGSEKGLVERRKRLHERYQYFLAVGFALVFCYALVRETRA